MSVIITELDHQGILTITLNRPEKLNALNHEVLDELLTTFEQAEKDPQTKALLITGQGKAFCAGADIKHLAEINAEQALGFSQHGQHVMRTLENLALPSVAAVNGIAFGGGCELAMAAHVRVAANTAQFSQPEVKLGVVPGYGGTHRLTRLVGLGRATDLCISGRAIDAQLAFAWGLVTEITAPENLPGLAKQRLQQILANAPFAVMSTIQALQLGENLSTEDADKLESTLFSLCCSQGEKKEGVTAFLEKRPPNFAACHE